jgi:acyl carrier protein
VLDMNRDLIEQKMPAHAFDVIIAANVLHATQDLGSTLEQVRLLLASGGVLLIYEVTEHLPWFDVTFALIEGWQKHADDRRQQHPLLKPDAWAEVLEEHGFEAVAAFPKSGSLAEILGHHVLFARGPRLEGATTSAKVPIRAARGRSVAASPSQPPAAESKARHLIDRLADLSPAERIEELVEFVRGQVAEVLRLDPAHPPRRTQRLMDIGIDSLMAVELSGRLSSQLSLKRSLRSTLIFDHPTIQAIAEFIERSEFSDPVIVSGMGGAKPQKQPGTTAADFSKSVAELSDEQVEQMLLAKLREIQ